MDGPKRCGERERWLCRELFRERHRLFQQFTTSHDPVDQAEIEGLPCIELAPAENQLSGGLAADMPWQTLRSAKRRNDADIDFCLGKDGCVRGKGDVHRLHELAATTEREAIDGRDDRLRKLLDPTGQLMPRPHEMRDRFGWARLHIGSIESSAAVSALMRSLLSA